MARSDDDLFSWKIDDSYEEEQRQEYVLKSHPEESEDPNIITLKGNTKSFIEAAQNAKHVFKRRASKHINGIEAKVLDLSTSSMAQLCELGHPSWHS